MAKTRVRPALGESTADDDADQRETGKIESIENDQRQSDDANGSKRRSGYTVHHELWWMRDARRGI
jgi:hypothetical protein